MAAWKDQVHAASAKAWGSRPSVVWYHRVRYGSPVSLLLGAAPLLVGLSFVIFPDAGSDALAFIRSDGGVALPGWSFYAWLLVPMAVVAGALAVKGIRSRRRYKVPRPPRF